jgi:hypothetical protein
MSGPLLGLQRAKTAGLLVIGGGSWAYFPSFSTVVQRIPQIKTGRNFVAGAQVHEK